MKVLVNRPDFLEKNGAARQFDCDGKRYHYKGKICLKVKDKETEELIEEKLVLPIRS